MRQNSLEKITGKRSFQEKKNFHFLFFQGIEIMKSIEELDLSDNFITLIPEQIRHLSMIKRVRLTQ